MKTIREWFEMLPEPYRTKALANTAPDNRTEDYPSLISALDNAFVWDETQEGGDYWHELFKTL